MGVTKRRKQLVTLLFLKRTGASHNQFAKKVSAVTAIMIVYNPPQNAPS